MKKIAIVDTDHYFYIYSLVDLFSNGDTEITIYTNPKVYKRCLDDLSGRTNIRYEIQKERESWGDFLQRNVSTINTAGYGYVFLCPIYNYYKEHYQFIKKLTTLNILVVFNLNGWINPPFNSLHWFWNTWYKRKIIKLIGWIAIDEHFHDHAVKLGCKNNILHIPSLLFDPKYTARRQPTCSPYKIIVPGSIHDERRDYNVVLDAFSIVLKKRQDIEVVLLGDPIGPYGKSILDRAEKMNQEIGKIIFKTYPKEYNDAEFLRQIISGHFLIAPVLPEFKLDGITEVYGTSKSTGSCFDILAYAIVGIFPSWLSVNSHFDSSTLRYKNADDLSQTILDLLDHPDKLEKLRSNALANSAHYSVENVRERLFRTLPPPAVK